jgi:DNA invertase Pin-like site-specific DNA recombinase
VFKEKVGGAKTDRAKLAKLLRRIEPGDMLIVTRLDRLVALYQRPAQRHRCACRSGLSCKRCRKVKKQKADRAA